MTFAQLRRLCMSLPEVEERETWGEATFRVRDKIFVMGSPDSGFASVKASLHDQSGLVAMDPDTFAVSAYTGRFGWVRVTLATVPDEFARRLITSAWRLTAPKRLVSVDEIAGVSTPGAELGSRRTSAPPAGGGRPRRKR